jgi:hypothetical protein
MPAVGLPPVPGNLLQDLHQQIVEKFGRDELARLVRFHLTVELDNITAPGTNAAVFYEVLGWVEQHGRWGDFLSGVKQARPLLPALHQLCDAVWAHRGAGPLPAGNPQPAANPPPAPMGWPFLLPSGQAFVDREPVQKTVEQMTKARVPRVLRILGVGKVGKTHCVPFLHQAIQQHNAADRIAIIDLSRPKYTPNDALAEKVSEDVLNSWRLVGSLATPPGRESPARSVNGLALALAQALPVQGGDGWMILDGVRAGMDDYLADFIEELGTIAMNGPRLWLILVGYTRPFSSPVLNSYCRSLRLAPLTADHLRQYFTDLRACLKCAANAEDAGVAAVLAEFAACQPSDPERINILSEGVQSLALHLAGLE